MKKVTSCLLLLGLLTSCGVTSNSNSTSLSVASEEDSSFELSSDSTIENKDATYVNVKPISYENVKTRTDMVSFYKETQNEDGASHDGKHDYGFVKSIWHELKVNNQNVEVYSARCGYGIHSFAYVDIDTDGLFNIDVELSFKDISYSQVDVLPLKKNVNATINDGIIKATISDFGDFTFVLDEKPDYALTLYVASERKVEIPSGYDKVEIEPAKYENDDLKLTSSNKFYYFTKGTYDINYINFDTDSIIYFEPGCYFRVYEAFDGDYTAALSSAGSNIKVLGRALFDFSLCVGGDAKTKGVYNFSGENIYIEGITTINSNNWSMCFSAANNIEVCQCMFFSYRTYSDGIMFSDCTNGYAHDNFVRTGDDACECKAFTNSPKQTNNILFENNSVWTDKGLAYGCVYESVHDIENVVFKNNSVGFAQACWSDHLGCCVMQMGSMKTATWHDVHFENIEIFKTSCAVISLFNRANDANQGGKIRDIYFKNITCKYINQVNLPVYCISVVIRLAEGLDYTNCTIGNAYIDNVDYCGTIISKDNYKDYTNINISENGIFSKSSLKFNTLENE